MKKNILNIVIILIFSICAFILLQDGKGTLQNSLDYKDRSSFKEKVAKKKYQDTNEVIEKKRKEVSVDLKPLLKKALALKHKASFDYVEEVQAMWLLDLYGHLKFLDKDDADRMMKEYLELVISSHKIRSLLEKKYEKEKREVADKYTSDEKEALEIAFGYLEVGLEKKLTQSYNDETYAKESVFSKYTNDIMDFLKNKELEYKVVFQDDDLYIFF